MNESIMISVIIPIYMVERYIHECISTVLDQTYRNLEIILIDDGSTDNSPHICDEYAVNYNQVKVIHKENGGLSDARNVGIHESSGDYILFLDGDDFWDDKDAVFHLVERISVTGADVLNFSYKKYYEDTNAKVPYFSQLPSMPIEYEDKIEQLDYITRHGLYIASACNKLIKKKLFTEEMLFKKGVYSEDIEWCARLLKHAGSMDFICENFYCYRQRRDSITHTVTDKKCEDLYNNILACFQIIEVSDSRMKDILYRYTAYQYGTFFVVQARTTLRQSDIINKLKKYSWILSYHAGNKKLFILDLLCKILGYKNTCGLIRFIIRKRGRK